MHLKRSMLFVCALLLTQASCTTPQPVPVFLEPPLGQEYIETDLKIGLALGGGGASGLAHITVLEAFDQLGLKKGSVYDSG